VTNFDGWMMSTEGPRTEMSVGSAPDIAPTHLADYPQFSGVFGYLGGLTMIAGRGPTARLVCDLAGVGADDEVLDIGCGPGTAARAAARRGATVTGIDPSDPMLALARMITRLRRSSGQTDWVKAGAEKLTIEDETATVCWSLASVHHWPDLDGGLDEVLRVLRPGGMFLALEKRTQPGATGNASHGWTPAQAQRFSGMLTELGFSEVEVADHDLGRRKVVVVQGRK
jgi:ubiquinone/menaquinone biosynthesis C-methylase UbiE